MILRYYGDDMRKIWDGNIRKFHYWLLVEVSVLVVREQLGKVPQGTAERIKRKTWVDELVAQAIERRDKEISHDLNAFLEIMRLQITMEKEDFVALVKITDNTAFQTAVKAALASGKNSTDAGWFHDGMTSYDTEEPAIALLYRDGCNLMMNRLSDLRDALHQRARTHRAQIMMGRTHGQHAQPITFGIKCVNWYEMVKDALRALERVSADVQVMKLSGAVGVYGTIDPQVERMVGEALNLKPVVATQIVPLQYRVRVTNEFAVVAGIIEKIAYDLWLMSQTEVGEVREPFGANQKGSSAMPHKKNPITVEQLMGMASLIRSYAIAMAAQIKTAHERDIGHSSVERTAGVDAFGILDHMLRKFVWIIKDLKVIPERMLKNMDISKGTFASQRVAMLLIQHGMPAEAAYRIVQEASFKAVDQSFHLEDVLQNWDLEVSAIMEAHADEFKACFDPQTWVLQESYIYEQAGIN